MQISGYLANLYLSFGLSQPHTPPNSTEVDPFLSLQWVLPPTSPSGFFLPSSYNWGHTIINLSFPFSTTLVPALTALGPSILFQNIMSSFQQLFFRRYSLYSFYNNVYPILQGFLYHKAEQARKPHNKAHCCIFFGFLFPITVLQSW